MKAILHALAHAGLAAMAAGAVAWPLLPPPFNLIVGASCVGGSAVLGYFGVKTGVTVAASALSSATSAAKKAN